MNGHLYIKKIMKRFSRFIILFLCYLASVCGWRKVGFVRKLTLKEKIIFYLLIETAAITISFLMFAYIVKKPNL